MIPSVHSKFSQDYRFLPDLLMPIVTIDEVQNETGTSRTTRNNAKLNKNALDDHTEKPTTNSNQKPSFTASENLKTKIKSEDQSSPQETLISKIEIDIDSIKKCDSVLKNVKIKEEKQDSDETSDNYNDPDLLNSVAKVITLASKIENNPPGVVNLDVVKKEINTDVKEQPAEPVKRKRGRPRKNPEEKIIKTKKKGKKKKKSNRKLKSAIKPKKLEVKEDESVLPKYQCPICKDDEKRTEKQLRFHYKNAHHGRRLRTSMLSTEMVPCDVCGKEFKSSYHLKEHMETHSNCFSCDICNSSHRKALDYVIHMRIHSEKGFFKCIYCPFITEDIIQITEHLNTCQDKYPQYVCKTCKKGFHVLSWFEEHSNFHTGLKPFSCDLCGKYFMYSRFLAAHKSYMHREELGGLNIYKCVICFKEYQHRNSLKLHMNSHTGNFAICDVCGKILSSREKLKFHMRTHTGYKPFDCTYCGKCFTKKPILVEHIRIHTGERPYVCEYCTKAFSQRSSLVIHIRSHTGERPFVCHLCNKGYVAKAMLNIHLKACKGIIM